MQQHKKTIVIVTSKKRESLGESLRLQLIEKDFSAVAWTEDEFEKMDPTKSPQFVIFVEDSKPMKRVRSSMEYVFSVQGAQIGIRATQSIINVDQSTFSLDHLEELKPIIPIAAAQEISQANEAEGALQKGFEASASKINYVKKGIGAKLSHIHFGSKKEKDDVEVMDDLSNGVVSTDESKSAIENEDSTSSKLVTDSVMDLLYGAVGIGSTAVSKQAVIDDIDIALLYIFSEFYLNDFVANDVTQYAATDEVVKSIQENNRLELSDKK